MSKVRIQRAVLFVASVTAAGLAARPAHAQTGLQYYAVTPCRAVDTRSGFGGTVQASVFRGFTMKGVCGVPSTAKAVSLNLTIVGPSADGFFSLWPYGGPFPTVATINFAAGEPAIANGAIVPLATGTPDLYGGYGTANGQGTTQAIMDVTGYFQ
jgi:hypothetical protein